MCFHLLRKLEIWVFKGWQLIEEILFEIVGDKGLEDKSEYFDGGWRTLGLLQTGDDLTEQSNSFGFAVIVANGLIVEAEGETVSSIDELFLEEERQLRLADCVGHHPSQKLHFFYYIIDN